MTLIKNIDRYILKNFFKTFSITFFGSIFVLVMQFLFRYIDDLVGKGVGFLVLGEFFFYACLTLVPLSLPLSILIGSLMTFGNLGERLELLAMKAAGISLFRIMQPLIICMVIISIGSFYFSNNILPPSQVRMWTLIFSIREKSPELDIPEGSFYNGITGRNIYVGNKTSDMLQDVIIYDYSNGFSNTSIILADTGYISLTENKKQLILTLHSGETFENLQQQNASSDSKSIPYRRETFAQKIMVIDFDANFKEMSSDFLEGQHVSKNTTQLLHAMDSIANRTQNLKEQITTKFLTRMYFNKDNAGTQEALDSTAYPQTDPIQDVYLTYLQADNRAKEHIIRAAAAQARIVQSECISTDNDVKWIEEQGRFNAIEWHKKFTLSFACFIFLFIGAPLGAIIRKGGMGMPLVLSTVLFITYYIIDNTGYKMAREGIWEVWQGMWLSAFILLPLGIILTYMAATESTIMNGESYKLVIKKIFTTFTHPFKKKKEL